MNNDYTGSIFTMIYNDLDSNIKHDKKYNTKIAKKVFDTLDKEAISDIILDHNVYWFEHYQHHDYVTSDVYNWLKKYLNRRGYKYLGDI